MDPFEQKKAHILKEIASSKTDASPKGNIDEKCLPIMEVINANKDMVTTSSCSGRLSVFLEGIKQKSQIGAKGNEGRWLFVTHNKEDTKDWWESIDFKYEALCDVNHLSRYILFKYEPFILHVKCRNLETATKLYTAAMSCGYRESGIGANNVVAVRISIRLDIPIGCLNERNEYISFVSKEYLSIITKLAESRFEENERKFEVLRQSIISAFKVKPVEKVETKEERRQRKIQEGMARRESVLREKQMKKEMKLKEMAEKEGKETQSKTETETEST